MKFKVLMCSTLLFLFAATTLGASKHNFQTAKLLDISTDERYVEEISLRSAIFSVQIGDLIYTARGGRIRPHSGDEGHGLIVGDDIQVAIDGGELIFLKPDGKEMKTKIIKRERVQ